MKKIIILLLTLTFCTLGYSQTQSISPILIQNIELILNQHYQQYKNQEYFSGMALSVSIPNYPIQNFYIGKVSHEKNSKPIDGNTLFQIGSISKSFTAVLILKLAEQHKLNLDDPISNYLSDYPKWGSITIRQLLNMTSGLPNYSESPTMNYLLTQNISHYWLPQQLIDMVYPKDKLNPPLKSGYYYTNTAYILAGMIIEKVTDQTYKHNLNSKILEPYGFKNTFYPLPNYEQTTKERLSHGYGFNQYENPELVGVDITNNNLSWAGAAGGIVANTVEVVNWVKLLFTSKILLLPNEKQQLMKLVSVKTGKAIGSTNMNDNQGFGLGVVQRYDKNLGRFWFYEGETLGFRTLYMYTPCNNIILAATFNSATNNENDHAHQLLKNVYISILDAYPKLECK